jgi:carboxylate-amine ligase
VVQFAHRAPEEIDGLRAAFEVARPMTIGIEEELMVLDPQTLDLTPRARDVLALLDGDPRFQPELPAAQLEIVGAPAATVDVAVAQLAVAREDLARAAQGIARFAACGAHPFAAARGELSVGEHYARLVAEFGSVLRRQLVFGLHVHVAVSDAERVLAVYNAVREYLPALAALGAGAPFYERRDTGLASVRPKICDLLPRQGIPPVITSWEAYAEALAWGGRTGPFAARRWWWEARVNPVVGTIEVRVADAQATVADTGALAGVVHALIATLAARHDAGELATEPAPTWRIEENRWSACRAGVGGAWVDARSGRATTMREYLHELLAELEPAARELACDAALVAARDLIERPRAASARETGPEGHAHALVKGFLAA